jgi:hypothetical protein
MENNTGWGVIKLSSRLRNKPKFHYFNDGRSLCHGTKPLGKLSDSGGGLSIACPTCVSKKRAIDNRAAKRTEALRGS